MAYRRAHRSRSKKGKVFTVRGHSFRARPKRKARKASATGGFTRSKSAAAGSRRRKRRQSGLKRRGQQLRAGFKFSRSGKIVRDRNAGRTRTRRRKQAGKLTGAKRQREKVRRRKQRGNKRRVKRSGMS